MKNCFQNFQYFATFPSPALATIGSSENGRTVQLHFIEKFEGILQLWMGEGWVAVDFLNTLYKKKKKRVNKEENLDPKSE